MDAIIINTKFLGFHMKLPLNEDFIPAEYNFPPHITVQKATQNSALKGQGDLPQTIFA